MLKNNWLFQNGMIVTIAGKPGSGKTTVAKEVAKRLGFKHLSTGDMRGQLAMEHGLTIDQLNEIGKKEDWTDKEVDKKVEQIGKTQDKLVIDSWLAFHFIPKSLKIFLDVDLKVAAKRIFANQRPDEEHKDTVEQVYEMITKRYQETVARYKKWYGVDISDLKNYDVVVDTTNLTQEQSIQKVLEFVKKS